MPTSSRTSKITPRRGGSPSKSGSPAINRFPKITRIHALTDSTLEDRSVRVVWEHPPASNFRAEAFNGQVSRTTATGGRATTLRVQTVDNSDPNTFDRTLVTLRNGANLFTFKVDDLKDGALYLPEYGAAILPDNDHRDYSAVANDVQRAGQKTLYDRIADTAGTNLDFRLERHAAEKITHLLSSSESTAAARNSAWMPMAKCSSAGTTNS